MSRGGSCRAGASVVTVAGDGTLTRCPFVDERIGNLYQTGLEAALPLTPKRIFCRLAKEMMSHTTKI